MRCIRRRATIVRDLTRCWLDGEADARALFPLDPWCADARARAVEAAAARAVAPAVRELLAAQAPAWRDPRAVAVVTGQQAGLFLGPLYTLYKAAHAVAAARLLSEETGRPVLPVFWVASEDHDVAEVASCAVPGDGPEPPRIAMPVPEGQTVPVADRLLGAPVVDALDRLEAALGGAPAGVEVMALVRRHYRPDASWSAAFTGLLAEIMDGTDLAIVDPRHPALLEAALPVHRACFARAAELAAALEERGRELEEAGFRVQAHVRPDAPLSFVHPDGAGGPRFRVEASDGGWVTVGDGRALGSLDAWLADAPSRFSSSALLRPVVQDHVLPTAAYVGGPGEIAYLAQTPPLYAALERPMPLVIPRLRLRVLGARERRALEQLELAPEDVARPRGELVAHLGARAAVRAPELPDPARLEAELLEPLVARASAFSGVASALDPALAKAVDRTVGSVTANVTRLVARYRRALAERDAVALARLDRLLGSLAPGGAPQERVHGWPGLAARFGVAPLRDAVLAAATELLPTAAKDIHL